MRKAHEALKKVTGMEYEVMGELEYYVVSEKDDLFLASDQRGYHESTPFNKGPGITCVGNEIYCRNRGINQIRSFRSG